VTASGSCSRAIGRAEPWFGLEEARLYAVSPERDTPADAELTPVTEWRGPLAEFAEGPGGAIAVIGAVHGERVNSYDQMSVLTAAGAWPLRDAKALAKSGHYAYGENINSDQHPPRGGGATPLAWTADGAAVIALAAREGSSLLVRVDANSGEEKELMPRGMDVIAGSCTPDGRRWALVIGTVDRPSDLYVLDTATGALTKRWAPNEELFGRLALGSVEEAWLPTFDGRKIHAWIVKPPDFDATKQYPLVLEIHGGPHTAYGFGFFHEFHVLAGAGNVVLYTNPRGSTSYGWEFANVIQYAFPGDDAKDLLHAVDAIVARGYVDPKKLGVTGGSGGGLLTNWLVTQTDRFAAAATQRCVSDWASMMYACDFVSYTPFWFKRQPHEDPRDYAERSPATYVDKITTPLMILHSEEDWRTPIAQGEILFRALKYLRRPVVMVRFPGENHELSRSGAPSHRVQNQQHIRRWFDHWLQGKKAEEYGV
jgi:dipeptidyl aminopeptidase/acylaminoacyl peptidase